MTTINKVFTVVKHKPTVLGPNSGSGAPSGWVSIRPIPVKMATDRGVCIIAFSDAICFMRPNRDNSWFCDLSCCALHTPAVETPRRESDRRTI